jgi:flavodoxin
MKMKKILLIVGVIAIIAVLAILAVMSVFIFDLWSMTAGGSETLNPAGNVTGHALVVYNPGISGSAKGVATTIANDLNAKGYAIVLAGVKSSAAASTEGYDVIVVGGPIYAGNQGSSIKSYLNTLTVPANAKLGIFATGQDKDILNDAAALRTEVSSLPENSKLTVKSVLKVVVNDDKDGQCAAFVNDLLN